jgi:hypothetical protein
MAGARKREDVNPRFSHDLLGRESVARMRSKCTALRDGKLGLPLRGSGIPI